NRIWSPQRAVSSLMALFATFQRLSPPASSCMLPLRSSRTRTFGVMRSSPNWTSPQSPPTWHMPVDGSHLCPSAQSSSARHLPGSRHVEAAIEQRRGGWQAGVHPRMLVPSVPSGILTAASGPGGTAAPSAERLPRAFSEAGVPPSAEQAETRRVKKTAAKRGTPMTWNAPAVRIDHRSRQGEGENRRPSPLFRRFRRMKARQAVDTFRVVSSSVLVEPIRTLLFGPNDELLPLAFVPIQGHREAARIADPF